MSAYVPAWLGAFDPHRFESGNNEPRSSVLRAHDLECESDEFKLLIAFGKRRAELLVFTSLMSGPTPSISRSTVWVLRFFVVQMIGPFSE